VVADDDDGLAPLGPFVSFCSLDGEIDVVLEVAGLAETTGPFTVYVTESWSRVPAGSDGSPLVALRSPASATGFSPRP